ncbi:unnamed protein product [Heligmosomoides polygyrus]|uniref:Uncharacterized protein n=1 Tax=Heligmosomoides polygyrus TaxID=6339 RepID=A0A183FKP2_HELPZ|nr:unnamed protein product [Heligmosomoides polygyrus]
METKMLRWTEGVTRMDRIRNDVIRQKFGIEPIADKMLACDGTAKFCVGKKTASARYALTSRMAPHYALIVFALLATTVDACHRRCYYYDCYRKARSPSEQPNDVDDPSGYAIGDTINSNNHLPIPAKEETSDLVTGGRKLSLKKQAN